MMNAIVAKTDKTFPWGIEIELVNGKCVYMAANSIAATKTGIDVIINKNNTISIPKDNIRKLLIMSNLNGS